MPYSQETFDEEEEQLADPGVKALLVSRRKKKAEGVARVGQPAGTVGVAEKVSDQHSFVSNDEMLPLPCDRQDTAEGGATIMGSPAESSDGSAETSAGHSGQTPESSTAGESENTVGGLGVSAKMPTTGIFLDGAHNVENMMVEAVHGAVSESSEDGDTTSEEAHCVAADNASGSSDDLEVVRSSQARRCQSGREEGTVFSLRFRSEADSTTYQKAVSTPQVLEDREDAIWEDNVVDEENERDALLTGQVMGGSSKRGSSMFEGSHHAGNSEEDESNAMSTHETTRGVDSERVASPRSSNVEETIPGVTGNEVNRMWRELQSEAENTERILGERKKKKSSTHRNVTGGVGNITAGSSSGSGSFRPVPPHVENPTALAPPVLAEAELASLTSELSRLDAVTDEDRLLSRAAKGKKKKKKSTNGGKSSDESESVSSKYEGLRRRRREAQQHHDERVEFDKEAEKRTCLQSVSKAAYASVEGMFLIASFGYVACLFMVNYGLLVIRLVIEANLGYQLTYVYPKASYDGLGLSNEMASSVTDSKSTLVARMSLLSMVVTVLISALGTKSLVLLLIFL